MAAAFLIAYHSKTRNFLNCSLLLLIGLNHYVDYKYFYQFPPII